MSEAVTATYCNVLASYLMPSRASKFSDFRCKNCASSPHKMHTKLTDLHQLYWHLWSAAVPLVNRPEQLNYKECEFSSKFQTWLSIQTLTKRCSVAANASKAIKTGQEMLHMSLIIHYLAWLTQSQEWKQTLYCSSTCNESLNLKSRILQSLALTSCW